MTTMLFYDKIVPLNRDRHRTLRIRTADGRARFASATHYVPLAGTEFLQAARDYPVMFAGGEQESGPIALLGLRERKNLFVDDEGAWSTGAYVPAFVRRYPFILAQVDDGKDYTVCFDESYDGFAEADGTALFDGDGKDSEYLTRTVDFLNRFLAEMARTQQFVDRLKELDLLVQRDLRVSDRGDRNFILRDFRVVDEEKLATLDGPAIVELHRSGFLAWIHAHLISLGNVTRLPARIGVEDRPAAAEASLEPDESDAEDPGESSVH